MNSRPPTIRDMPPPPHIVGLQHFTTFAEIDEILRSRSFRQGSHQESRPFFGRTLLTIDGDEHFERRRLEAPLFAKAALDHYEHTELIPLIHRTLEECRADRGGDGVVRADLCVVVRTMLARIAAATTGIDGVDTGERTDAFREYVELLGTGATVEWSTEDHDEVIGRILKVRDAFDREFFAPSVARRRELIECHRNGEIDREELPIDLITMLYLHWNEDWDEGLPIREACLFLVAATQTTTHAVPHLIAHLEEWFETHPEDRAKVSDGEFIKQAAHEALRLHQPSPALLRIANEDVVLAGGRRIAAGERVACLFTPANRDPEAFGADAREFNPYRDPAAVKPWGLTFGGGRHICIGRALVTGLSPRTDNDEGTDGTLVNIAGALYEAGVRIDPGDPPSYTEASHHDAYGRFPILLAGL